MINTTRHSKSPISANAWVLDRLLREITRKYCEIVAGYFRDVLSSVGVICFAITNDKKNNFETFLEGDENQLPTHINNMKVKIHNFY